MTFSRNLFVISTSLLNISFLSSRPRLLGLSKGSGFKFPSTIDTFMLSGINAFVVSASRFNRIFSRSSVSGFDGSIRLSARVGLLPQNDVSSRHLCGLGDLATSRVTLVELHFGQPSPESVPKNVQNFWNTLYIFVDWMDEIELITWTTWPTRRKACRTPLNLGCRPTRAWTFCH